MSQVNTYSNLNDGATPRRYSGFPLNSTLLSSYTLDTIRSIINHAAAGRPYSIPIWIRIDRVGIQISAQDPQIARTRAPVFIPIELVHDIFMLPSINHVICIVYDELRSNMKGVLLYVVHPSNVQLLRHDFRTVKQASIAQQFQPRNSSSPFDNRYITSIDGHPSRNNRTHTPIPANKSPISNDFYRNATTIRQQLPRYVVFSREDETNLDPTFIPKLPQLSYMPHKSAHYKEREEYNYSPKRSRRVHSPSKRSSETRTKRRGKHQSTSPEKQDKLKLVCSNSSQELSRERTNQQKQKQIHAQEQQWLIQQQQQIAAWEATQQMPFIPMGLYNRYVPKTIPLPTGETIKTTLPATTPNGTLNNGTVIAYIEPQSSDKVGDANRLSSVSLSNSYPNSNQQQNGSSTNQRMGSTNVNATVSSTHHRHHRTHDNVSGPSQLNISAYTTASHSRRVHSQHRAPKTYNNASGNDKAKQYSKMSVNKMQSPKMEMNRIRQTTNGTPDRDADSLQFVLKEMRSQIDLIRSPIDMRVKISK